jgi:hypothetical protein
MILVGSQMVVGMTLHFAMRCFARVASGNGIALLLALVSSAACSDYEHRAELTSLVSEQASEAEVRERLGLQFSAYDRGTEDWKHLESFLDREPAATLVPVREAVKKYRRILYHTTAWQITWVFLDEEGVIRDFYLTSQ